MAISEQSGEKDPKGRAKVKFAPAPSQDKVFNKDAQKRFNGLPGYMRHLVDRILEHGNLALASEEAGLKEHGQDAEIGVESKHEMRDLLDSGGLHPVYLVRELKHCLEATTMRMDKHGNFIPDYKTKLKTIELICKLRGDFERTVEKTNPTDLIEMFEEKDD